MPKSTSFAELFHKRILPHVLRIAILVFTIGFAFLLLHLPLVNQLIMIGISSLALAFFFLAYVLISVSMLIASVVLGTKNKDNKEALKGAIMRGVGFF